MAHSPETQRDCLTLLREGLSVRAVARQLGVSPSTVTAWQALHAEEALRAPESSQDGPTDPDEAAVATLLLRKAEALLAGIEYTTPKERSDTANAVDKLVSKYLAILGRSAESHVTVTHEREEELDAILQSLLPGQADEVEASTPVPSL